RAVLAQLLEEAWGDLDVDAVVAGAINDLDSRSVEATLEQVQRQLAVAPTDEKVTLTRQIHSLSRRLAELKPGRWNVIRTGRSSAV
ncbi:MAG: hypothetical protein IIA27_12730, partial [Gemmatimonadetes bacterium]|nr:hypothetical protein [Gemmatimonadota bacterium]